MTRMQKQQLLMERLQRLSGKKFRAVMGFDACLDTVVRPVQTLDEKGEPVYFSTIAEFGNHLAAHGGLSCAIDIRTLSKRSGGNMPNLSGGLKALGVSTVCIGPMGRPRQDPVFAGVGDLLFSVGAPGTCTALQFEDGKVMLSDMGGAAKLNYEQVKEALGEERLKELFGQCHLAGFVNWAELPCATELWRAVAENCWFDSPPDFSRFLLADLTDLSRRRPEEVREAAALVRECAGYRYTVMSLNQNEANQLSGALKLSWSSLSEQAEKLKKAVGIQLLVIHRNDSCILAENGSVFFAEGFLVEKPLISVGAGDVFNAALAFGLLEQFTIPELALFAGLYAACYVQSGHALTLEEIRRVCSTQ